MVEPAQPTRDPAASDAGAPPEPKAPALLGRTHVSGVRPHQKQTGRNLADILGDMEPGDWDPLSSEGNGPLTDAGLQTHGPRGDIIGEYQLVRKLGVGGFGAVYLARQLSTGRHLALKVLARSMATRPDFLHRFYREARTLSRLEHEHIVRGFEPFEADGWHCFAMEYIDGDSMQTWLRRLNRLGVGDACHVALCVASALHYAHELGLVHRDIKPENILLTRQGQVKVADLGLAKASDEDLSLTRSGTGFGTPHYMAPEQARNAKHADLRSDIYALGTTLFHFLTGQLPYKGDTALELILAKEQAPLPAMRKLNPEVTEQLDLVVYKMLAKNINHRYQTAAELIRDLQRLDLAAPTLSFVQVPYDAADTVPSTPEAITRAIIVNLPPGLPATTQRPSDHWWQARYSNSQGRQVTRKLTTRQLQEVILDERFDMKAEVAPEEGGEFLPLVSFAEFQPSVLRRQSTVTKTSAADSSVKLQCLYQEAETRLTAEHERRREEAAEHSRVRDLVQRPDVAGSFKALRELWRAHRNTGLGKAIRVIFWLSAASLLVWLNIKLIIWLQ